MIHKAQFYNFVDARQHLNITEQNRCGIIPNETIIHKRQNDTAIHTSTKSI